MKVIGSVATGVDAIAAARRLHPDVIIMDLVLPLLNGIDATRHIVCEAPHTHIVALSACRSLEHVRRMLRAGAHAYVLKSAGGNELTEAIKTVAAGHLYLSHELVALYGDKVLTAGPVNPIESLSDRERQVLRGLVAGLTSAEIGRRFSLSCKTVESYRCRMMMKLGISDRSALIRLAREYDLPEA
jgi:DNA-binding NarL/FixJ family response regulator